MQSPRLVTMATLERLVMPILEVIHLDPCADPEAEMPAVQKLTGRDGPASDGMRARWSAVGRNVWLFPPNRAEECHAHTLDEWVGKAHREYSRGATVLALLPARTTTDWFFDFVCRASAFTLVRDTYETTEVRSPGQILTLWSRDTDTKDRYLRVVGDNGLTLDTGL